MLTEKKGGKWIYVKDGKYTSISDAAFASLVRLGNSLAFSFARCCTLISVFGGENALSSARKPFEGEDLENARRLRVA